MKRPVVFALIREGTSDDGLLPHLQSLLLRNGIPEVVGQSRTYRGSAQSCLDALAAEAATVDVAFVHRDADGPSASERRQEIEAASLGFPVPVVPVIPIQELEAWLIVDPDEIRRVAGRPSGRTDLGLPKVGKIETTASPKEVLERALVAAADQSGVRRRKRVLTQFGLKRRTLLERLDIDGPVRQLSAWQALEADIAAAATRLMA